MKALFLASHASSVMPKSFVIHTGIILALLFVPSVGRAQVVPVGDVLEDYERVLQITGRASAASFTIRPQAGARLLGDTRGSVHHPWARLTNTYSGFGAAGRATFGVFDPLVGTFWNSGRPSGQNDGAVWQGRGTTLALSVGGFARYGVFSAALRPVLLYNENRDFELSTLYVGAGRSRYAYPRRIDIDLPQRFGPNPFARIDPGQSYVRVDYRGVALGVSNENMWWGPGLRNAIVLSNNAPGIPHVFLATSSPVDVYVGRAEGRLIWGQLSESSYFDSEVENDRRFVSGIALSYEPKWVPGLYVGVAHAFMLHHSVKKQLFRDYLGVLNLPFFRSKNGRTGGIDDKILSLFARWTMPESGFEVFGEWARGDHTADFRDIFVTPDHARGYTLGFQKVFEHSARSYLRWSAEVTNLQAPREAGNRDKGTSGGSNFYTHYGIRQGYTQRGQVVGAGIGPGANSQYMGLDLFRPWGKVGIMGLRQVYDNDLYYSRPGANNFEHEVEFGGGLSALVFAGGFEVSGAVTYTRLLNQDYEFFNDHSNVNVTATLRRSLMGLR